MSCGIRYRLSAALLAETFVQLRQCGQGVRECQVLWISDWANRADICQVVHPRHRGHAGGFQVASDWINAFWLQLASTRRGICVQIHTHPSAAFHSSVDDEYPIVHSIGFLSLVIPDFALGPIGFAGVYLAEIDPRGRWREVPIDTRLEVV